MKPMGKEVVQGIFGGLVAIVICVTIGSFIAQSIDFGHHGKKGKHGKSHGEQSKTKEADNKGQ